MVNGQTYRDFDQLTIDLSITTENWWLVIWSKHRVFDQVTIDQRGGSDSNSESSADNTLLGYTPQFLVRRAPSATLGKNGDDG